MKDCRLKHNRKHGDQREESWRSGCTDCTNETLVIYYSTTKHRTVFTFVIIYLHLYHNRHLSLLFAFRLCCLQLALISSTISSPSSSSNLSPSCLDLSLYSPSP